MLFKLFIVTLLLNCTGLEIPQAKNIGNDTLNKNHTSHNQNGLFSQNVKMIFYEDMDQCLNNDNEILKSNLNFNQDCTCLNSSYCMDTLFKSKDFKEETWIINGTTINGGQCDFKTGRVCDMCGNYPVRASVILFGSVCLNYSLLRFLLGLFILFAGIFFTFTLVICLNKIALDTDGRTFLRYRCRYRRLINRTDKPPNYTTNN
tara:strand:- start:1927 stop:2538 length:612 start_codon:yes stop_codon:yes gene_type:complete